jgi:hypothetical protein
MTYAIDRADGQRVVTYLRRDSQASLQTDCPDCCSFCFLQFHRQMLIYNTVMECDHHLAVFVIKLMEDVY